MRKFLIPIALVSAASMGAPAMAQRGSDHRLDQIAYEIDRAAQSGRVTDHHADSLYRGLRNIDRTERRYLRDGYLTGQERRTLNAKYRSIRRQLRTSIRYAGELRWNGRRRGW